MSKAIDLTGKRVGMLTVVGHAERKNGRVAWKCKCDCGNETVVLTTSLATGRTKSCGCYQKKRVSETSKKHGMFGTRLYRIWSNMIQRCENPNNDSFSLYGERGITVCDEWKDFTAFCGWAMSNGYANDLSIDRINNEKGYSPGNCKWSTPQEQTDNRRCTHHITHNGKCQTAKEWSKETGIPYATLLHRIRNKWPTEKILETESEVDDEQTDVP